MKKILIFITAIIGITTSIFAQVASDPNSTFYDNVQVWETKGLISNLPDMRPYPLPIIKQILNSVLEKGSVSDKKTALEWQESTINRSLHEKTDISAISKMSDHSSETKTIYVGEFGVAGDAEIIENLNISYDLNQLILSEYFGDIFPATTSASYDSKKDVGKIGSFVGVINMNSAFSYGTEKYWIQGGINRSSFGSFYDSSIVIAPSSYHVGNITGTIKEGIWTYQQSMFSLSATKSNGSGLIAGKYLAVHGLSIQPFEWLKLGYFESILWQDRFELTYFLPAPYMVGQSIAGYDDNIQMGLEMQLKPCTGVLWNSQILVDDISANDLAKLDFDTKIIAALETRISWAPYQTFSKLDFFKYIDLDYFFVNAYMYTHKPEDSDSDFNYVDFTHNGEQLSTQIEPNSHRIKLSAKFEPLNHFIISPFASFMQHGNVNESITEAEAIAYLTAKEGNYLTDGSVFDYPYIDGCGYDGYIDAYLYDWFFLEQEHIETTVQAGLDASYIIPFGSKKDLDNALTVSVEYTFEYINNCMDEAGDMFPGEKYRYDAAYYVFDADDVQDAINDWVSNLYDTFNNYLTLSIKYQY